jgi:hypothetical protein
VTDADPSEEGPWFGIDEPGGDRQVVLEDDGRVAYAYLLERDAIVADVWLYNIGEDPVDWQRRRGGALGETTRPRRLSC